MPPRGGDAAGRLYAAWARRTVDCDQPWGLSRCGEQSTLDPSGQRVPRNTLARDSVSRDSPHIFTAYLLGGADPVPASARGCGIHRRPAGGIVHHGQM